VRITLILTITMKQKDDLFPVGHNNLSSVQSADKSRMFLKILSTITIVLISLLLTLVSGCKTHPNIAPIDAELKSLVETKWTEYGQDRANFAGGLLIRILSPRGDYFVSAGLDNEAAENIHFRAASATKTFTAAAILLLDQQGKLNINDRIISNIPGTSSPYIPDIPEYGIPYKEEITIRQLLAHRAGVFDVSNSPVPDTVSAEYAGKIYVDYVKDDLGQINHTFTAEELIGVVAEHQLYYFVPGDGYHYSNTGYSLLGKIIERISGMDYASFLNENLLKPNGLADTSFPSDGNDRQIPVPYAQGHSIINGIILETTQDNMSAHVAEGNMITTPNDLSQWVKLLYSGKTSLNKEYVDMMTDVNPTGEGHGNYGLGTSYIEGLGYGHNGAHMGYMTVMAYDKENDVAIVISSSVLNFDDIIGEIQYMYDIGQTAKRILGY